MLANIFLFISGLIILLLGLLVLVGNPKRGVNRAFFAFSLSGLVWLVTNLLTNISREPSYALVYARMAAVGAALIALTFLIFCLKYTSDKPLSRGFILAVSIIPILLILLSPTEFNISSIEAYGKNAKTGVYYYLLLPGVALYFAAGFVALQRAVRNASSVQKARLRYMIVGLLLTVVPAIILNGVLPVMGLPEASAYGPGVVVILAFFMTMAIARHRLLDIRFVAVRSLGYVMSVATLIGLYWLFALLLFSVASEDQVNNTQLTIFAIFGIATAFALQPVKKFYDRITNKYFYQDAYDPELFLAEVNKIVVSEVDVEQLLQHVAETVTDNLKTDFAVFDLRKTAYVDRRVISSGEFNHPPQGLVILQQLMAVSQQRVVTMSEEEERDKDMFKELHDQDIAVAAKLAPMVGFETQGYGLLLIGAKKSGNQFTKQDINIIRIIAGELSIAVQNALRYEEIENFNVTLQDKVDDATKKLKKANDKLTALDETKDEFISMASHQLRTPLTSVKGYLSMVLEGDAGKLNDMQRKLLEQSFTSSQRMVFLIADLLNLSRLRTGKFLVEPVPTNLSDIIQGEVEQLKETAAARSLKLEYDKPETFPTLMLDETKIRQVIMNFVDNAIYYTPSGGKIVIGLAETPKSIEFTVKDSGIGVPKSEQQHLFSKFFRAGNAQKARPDGTGLGLFMAKKVIVALGGALIFSSKEGQGSTFGFSFSKDKIRVPDKPQATPDTKL